MHACTISCQVFLNEERVCCEGFSTPLPCLTQPFVRCIAIYLDLFCCHSNAATVHIFCSLCLCSPGALRELWLKNW